MALKDCSPLILVVGIAKINFIAITVSFEAHLSAAVSCFKAITNIEYASDLPLDIT